MDSSQQEHRQAAAEAFMESLNQLEHQLEKSLSEEKGKVPETSAAPDRSMQSMQSMQSEQHPQLPQGETSILIDVLLLEEAVADIEQFMQTKNSGVGE